MSCHNSEPLKTPTVREMVEQSGGNRPPWIVPNGRQYPGDCLGCGCRYVDHGEPGLACPEFAGGFSRVHKYRDTSPTPLPSSAPAIDARETTTLGPEFDRLRPEVCEELESFAAHLREHAGKQHPSCYFCDVRQCPIRNVSGVRCIRRKHSPSEGCTYPDPAPDPEPDETERCTCSEGLGAWAHDDDCPAAAPTAEGPRQMTPEEVESQKQFRRSMSHPCAPAAALPGAQAMDENALVTATGVAAVQSLVDQAFACEAQGKAYRPNLVEHWRTMLALIKDHTRLAARLQQSEREREALKDVAIYAECLVSECVEGPYPGYVLAPLSRINTVRERLAAASPLTTSPESAR